MAGKLEAVKSSLDQSLRDERQPWTKIFALAEAKTGFDRTYIFVVFIIFFALYLLFGYAAQLICSIFGFVYPAYASLKALETPKKDDDTKWLTYWVVFAFFSLIEYFSGFIVYYLPFYWLMKCIFHLWCFIPIENNGSMLIYNRIIRPYFLQHQANVDSVLNNLAGSAKQFAADKASKLAAESFSKKD